MCPLPPPQGQKVNEAACDIARQVADEGDALVAGGVSQTPSYLSCKSEAEVKSIFRQQLEVFVKKNVDFLIAEVREGHRGLACFLVTPGGWAPVGTAVLVQKVISAGSCIVVPPIWMRV